MTLVQTWQTAQRAEGIATTTLGERMRLMARFSEALPCLPEHATTQQIAEWFSAHYDCWAPATKSSYYGHLKSYYRWLVLMDYRQDDPMARIKRTKVPRTQPRPVPDEHMPRLLGAANRKRTRAMILLGALAGLRVSEIAKVRGEDFDLLGGILRVSGKGGVVADIAIHPMLATVAMTMPRRGPWFPTRGNRTGRDAILGRSVSTIIGHTNAPRGRPGHRALTQALVRNDTSGRRNRHAHRSGAITPCEFADGADLHESAQVQESRGRWATRSISGASRLTDHGIGDAVGHLC